VASAEQLNVLRKGPHIWNRWREQHPEIRPDLRAANLRESDLANADLRDCDLRGAVLLGAKLEYADLTKANLSFSDLRFVELKGANLRGAVFREAKGVSPEILRSAAGPSRARQAAIALVPLIAVIATIGFALVQLKQSQSRETSVLAATPAPPPLAESPPARSDSLDEVQRALSGLDFGEWSVTRTEAYGDTATLRVDRDQVSDEIYIPTLAGVCGILAGVRQAGALRQIHIVNREGWQGWTYQAPENCRALMRTPPTMMRLAIAGDSRPF